MSLEKFKFWSVIPGSFLDSSKVGEITEYTVVVDSKA